MNMTEQRADKLLNFSLLKRNILRFVNLFIFLFCLFGSIWLFWFAMREISWGRLVVSWNIVLGFVQALAWPIVILGIAIIFKREVASLFERMKKANWGDKSLEFEPMNGQPRPPEIPSDIQNEAASEASSPATATTTTTQVRTPTADELLARPDIQLIFERIYRIMFGTQLEALKRLHAYPDGLKTEDLTDIYDRHKTKAPNPQPSVIDLMSFLVNADLINYDSQTRIYRLLPVGELFLRYFREQNWLDMPKPF